MDEIQKYRIVYTAFIYAVIWGRKYLTPDPMLLANSRNWYVNMKKNILLQNLFYFIF